MIVITGVAYSRDWHGLIPLHSTRADVERLLGPPRHSSDGVSIYSNDEGIIQIFFAGSKSFNFMITHNGRRIFALLELDLSNPSGYFVSIG